MKRWFAHAPGMVYAVNVYADDAAGAKQKLREFLGVKRLPAGSCVWEG